MDFKIIVNRNDFEGQNLVDKVNIFCSYPDAMLSIMDNTDLLKAYALVFSHIQNLKTETVASDFPKVKKPFQKRLDAIANYFQFDNARVGFNVADLGVNNFVLNFSKTQELFVAEDADVFKLLSFFPSLNKYLKFDKVAFMKDLSSQKLSEINLDILRTLIPNFFGVKTVVNDATLLSSKELNSFNWSAAESL